MAVQDRISPQEKTVGRRRGPAVALLAALAAAMLAGPSHAGLEEHATGQLQDFSVAPLPEPAPRIDFVDADGEDRSLADFQGKVVLLNFWATWCAPCVAEMPSLDRLQAELGGPRFQVVAVSVDRGGIDTAQQFLDKLEIAHLAAFNDRRMESFRAFGGKVMPTSVLIGPQGQVLGRLEGPAEWDSGEALALIRAAMAESGAGG